MFQLILVANVWMALVIEMKVYNTVCNSSWYNNPGVQILMFLLILVAAFKQKRGKCLSLRFIIES